MKNKIFRLYIKLKHLLRLKYWRGHGIHSPFVYGIVRNVIMRKRLFAAQTLQGVDFHRLGIAKKDALIIRNLYTYLAYSNFVLVTEKNTPENFPNTSQSNKQNTISPPSTSPSLTQPDTSSNRIQPQSDTFYFFPLESSDAQIESFVTQITPEVKNCCLLIGSIHKSQKRHNSCRRISRENNCVTLNLHHLYILFFGRRIQKQYYRLRY